MFHWSLSCWWLFEPCTGVPPVFGAERNAHISCRNVWAENQFKVEI